jgi:hypothetical protein
MLIEVWFVIICLMVVAGIVFRLWQRQLPPVKIHKVAPKAASQLVGEFIASSYDGQFGYPSGLFQIENSTESRVVAQEIVGRGSHFTQILKGMYVAVLAVGDNLGCIGGIIALAIAVVLTPAIVYAALAEALLKYLLRSRIVTSLEAAGDATTVAFTLRGPVALLVGRRLERAFHAPVLPARLATLTGMVVPGASRTGATGTPEITASADQDADGNVSPGPSSSIAADSGATP